MKEGGWAGHLCLCVQSEARCDGPVKTRKEAFLVAASCLWAALPRVLCCVEPSVFRVRHQIKSFIRKSGFYFVSWDQMDFYYLRFTA